MLLQKFLRSLMFNADPRAMGKTKGNAIDKNTREGRQNNTLGAKESLTVTSASDLGEVCHLGLYLLHVDIVQGCGTSPTSSRMHQVPSLLTVVIHDQRQ